MYSISYKFYGRFNNNFLLINFYFPPIHLVIRGIKLFLDGERRICLVGHNEIQVPERKNRRGPSASGQKLKEREDEMVIYIFKMRRQQHVQCAFLPLEDMLHRCFSMPTESIYHHVFTPSFFFLLSKKQPTTETTTEHSLSFNLCHSVKLLTLRLCAYICPRRPLTPFGSR